MKKITAIMLVMILTVALSIPTFAAGEVTSEGTKNSTLTYTVSQSFTVTIPESVTIGPAKSGTGTISVANSVIPFGKNLKVTITDATNYDVGGNIFRLKDGDNANYVNYTIKKADTSAVTKGTAFLTVAAGAGTGSETLTFTAENPTKAGTYTDGLTFTVSVD